MKFVRSTLSCAAIALASCSSSGQSGSTVANDGGGVGSNEGGTTGNPCYVPTGASENLVANPSFVPRDATVDESIKFKWQLQAFSDGYVRIELETENTGGTFGSRMYNACKKLAEDLGATGNEIARTLDEPTVAAQIKKVCALAYQYVQGKTDQTPDVVRHGTVFTCVSRVSDAEACLAAVKGVAPKCLATKFDATKELVNGECINGSLALPYPCGAIAAAKAHCKDDSGSERPKYLPAPSGAGKNNEPLLDFMEALPFFFPTSRDTWFSLADMLEMNLTQIGSVKPFGPEDAVPSCRDAFRQQVATQLAPFLEMQEFAKMVRQRYGLH